jgi:diketogulonate reductase-like aldo/keto reductase
LFVTSKVWCTQCHPELVLPSLKESLMYVSWAWFGFSLIFNLIRSTVKCSVLNQFLTG